MNPAPTPFTIRWTERGYVVSRPDIDEAEVVLASEHQAALATKDAEIARRKAQLDMWTSAAMDGNAVIAQLTARAEKAEAERDALRTLWTEARVVVAQCRDANCLVSYGKAQCDAVAAANAWLDKMPATVKRTIDDASNTEWQLQRVIAERDQLRAAIDAARSREPDTAG